MREPDSKVDPPTLSPASSSRTLSPNVLFTFGELPETPPEKNFEAENSAFDFDDTFDNYDDLDFDENWN